MNYRTLALLNYPQPRQAEAPTVIDYTQPTYADLPNNPQNPIRLGRQLQGVCEGELIAHTVTLNEDGSGKAQEAIVFTPAPDATEPTSLFTNGGEQLHTMLQKICQAAAEVCADRGMTVSGDGDYTRPNEAKIAKIMRHTADIIDFWGADFPQWRWRKGQH
jgi:hypothetical protein